MKPHLLMEGMICKLQKIFVWRTGCLIGGTQGVGALWIDVHSSLAEPRLVPLLSLHGSLFVDSDPYKLYLLRCILIEDRAY